MTASPLPVGTDYETLANRFRPLFRKIAAGTLEREQARELPHEPIRWLKQAGFGAVRGRLNTVAPERPSANCSSC